MDKYPLLKLIKANGGLVALALGLVGLVAGLALWPLVGPLAILPAIGIGALGWLTGRLVVELIRLITDVLMPE
jgi:hypothetical protein